MVHVQKGHEAGAKAEGKLSNTDPVLAENSDIFFALEFYMNFDF